jgi:hypothetical protein
VVRLARENSGWGYDRIVGALANLGYPVSHQTVGHILRRHGIGPVSERSQTTAWKDFIRRHMDVLAGTDFSVDVLTWRGLVTYYVLFFIHLDSRRISIAGITDRPEACWMRQVAGNATFAGMGHLNGRRYLLHDRDAKFCAGFRETLAAGGVKGLTPASWPRNWRFLGRLRPRSERIPSVARSPDLCRPRCGELLVTLRFVFCCLDHSGNCSASVVRSNPVWSKYSCGAAVVPE